VKSGAKSISEILKELSALPPKRLSEVVSRLAKHKKENKELLTYLFFDADDEEAFIDKIKAQVDQLFDEINKSNLYYSKKSLRKILRIINKHVKFSGKPATEIELRIYFCTKIRKSGIQFTKSTVLMNLYAKQVEKIESSLEKVHEDLRFDYKDRVDSITKLPHTV
jgi:hypothetical protein